MRISQTPLFVLAPPRSFTSVTTAMLGQHPQMFGFPETYLLSTTTVAWWQMMFGSNPLSHGLMRLIAQCVLGEQSEAAIQAARLWLWRRRELPTVSVFREISERIYPRLPIDKTPLVTDLRFMKPALTAFPQAKFLHLTRHPISQGKSYLEFLRAVLASYGLKSPLALERTIMQPGSLYRDLADYANGAMIADPQMRWYRSNATILEFLNRVPQQNRMLIRGEDLLRDPDPVLHELASWLGVRHDAEAIERMKHPENSPFACIGPSNARFGNDPKFLQAPKLRPRTLPMPSLYDPPPWRPDGRPLGREVRQMAASFGYN